MELIKVNEEELENVLKSTKGKGGKLQKIIESFVCSGEKMAKLTVDKSEYKDTGSLYGSMVQACRRSRHRVHVKRYKSQIYIVRDEA